MSERREIAEPGELVFAPRPSWAPVVLAFSAAVALCGVFLGEFMLAGWIWSILGLLVGLGALRSLVRGGVRGYYRLPRRQATRGAVLPVETVSPPKS